MLERQALDLVSLILRWNKPYRSVLIDSRMSRIDPITATQIATLLIRESQRSGLPLLYMAAAIFQESMFDPNAYNRNLKLLDREVSFARTDWGLCQFSGRYLHTKPGMLGLSEAEMVEKVYDPRWAIPVFADIMASNVRWATEKFRNHEPLFVATLAYNKGRRGAEAALASGETQHADKVMKWYRKMEEEVHDRETPDRETPAREASEGNR